MNERGECGGMGVRGRVGLEHGDAHLNKTIY